jgi:kynureninase
VKRAGERGERGGVGVVHVRSSLSTHAHAADLTRVNGEDDCVYLTGNSLGLQPRETSVLVNEELTKWARR